MGFEVPSLLTLTKYPQSTVHTLARSAGATRAWIRGLRLNVPFLSSTNLYLPTCPVT